MQIIISEANSSSPPDFSDAQMVVHLLLHCSPCPLHTPPSSFSIKKAIFLCGFRIDCEFLGSRKSRKYGGFLKCALEKDSEYEVEPEKAREALRKLDEQLQSLSKKQVNPPKIRAVDMKQQSSINSREERQESSEISGSFLASAAAALLLFTIFYNILFLTVIKPSIDGDGAETAISSAVGETTEEESQSEAALQQFSTITRIPLAP